MADDDDDAPFVGVQGSCSRTLHQLPVRVEHRAEGNVDAARNMTSAKAEVIWVKDQRF